MGLAIMTRYVKWDDVPLVLGTQEVADVLDVHVNTVKNLISRSEIKAFKVGRVWKVNRSDLKKYMGLPIEDEKIND